MNALELMEQQQEMPVVVRSADESPNRSVAELLVKCAAFAKELETQAHLIHLNYEGANFLAVHAYLKERYEEHLGQFDALAEYVRSQDYLLPMCSCGLKDAAVGFEQVSQYSGEHMLLVYHGNLQRFAQMARLLEKEAGSCDCIDVQNYAAELVGDASKAAWFVKATLRCGHLP
jgi:DNA-binding ferritin-like protein